MSMNLPLVILPQSMYEDEMYEEDELNESPLFKALKERETEGREPPKIMPYVS